MIDNYIRPLESKNSMGVNMTLYERLSSISKLRKSNPPIIKAPTDGSINRPKIEILYKPFKKTKQIIPDTKPKIIPAIKPS